MIKTWDLRKDQEKIQSKDFRKDRKITQGAHVGMGSKYDPDAPVRRVMMAVCTLGHPKSAKAEQVVLRIPNASEKVEI